MLRVHRLSRARLFRVGRLGQQPPKTYSNMEATLLVSCFLLWLRNFYFYVPDQLGERFSAKDAGPSFASFEVKTFTM